MRAPSAYALAASLLLTAGASAQIKLGPRAEEGVTDYEPSRLGLRVVNPDMREDVGFDHIYFVEGHDDLFARRAGGITAVFPRSVYYKTRRGVEYTVIPPGTIFYIGDAPRQPDFGPPTPEPRPARATLAQPLSAQDSGRINLAAPAATLEVKAGQPATAQTEPPADEADAPAEPQRSRTMSDETYRRTRLREIASRLADETD